MRSEIEASLLRTADTSIQTTKSRDMLAGRIGGIALPHADKTLRAAGAEDAFKGRIQRNEHLFDDWHYFRNSLIMDACILPASKTSHDAEPLALVATTYITPERPGGPTLFTVIGFRLDADEFDVVPVRAPTELVLAASAIATQRQHLQQERLNANNGSS